MLMIKIVDLQPRAAFSAVSKEIDMIGRIHTDTLFKERYMLNEVNVRMKLTRSKDAFSLTAAGRETYDIVIVLVSLLICKV